MIYMDLLKAQLIVDEGNKRFPYTDTKGKVTIGIGRNLSDIGLSLDEVDFLFAHDLNRAVLAAISLFPTFNELSDNRRAVLCNMAFNMGRETLGKFHATIESVTKGNYNNAAEGMLMSLWAKQVGDRAKRLALTMRKG